jgi:hypothetical protein
MENRNGAGSVALLVEPLRSRGRATLPAPFCFRGPKSLAGCIAPTKNRFCYAIADDAYVMSSK